MSSAVKDVISHLAKGNDLLSNETIWKMAWNNGDKVTCQSMLELKCVAAFEVADIARTNRLIEAKIAERAMWASGNPGPLAQANIYAIENSSTPIFKKWEFVYVPGAHFCQLIMNKFQEQITEARDAINAAKQLEIAEQNRRFQEKLKEEERSRKFRESLENYNSPAEVEKRNAVVRAAYSDKLTIFSHKQQIEEALDEIYFLTHAPGDLILPVNAEIPFQRRTKAEREAFVKANKPLEPKYEEPWELNNGRYRIKLQNLKVIDSDRMKPTRLDDLYVQRRPILYHEQKLEVFNQLYRIDRRSFSERLEQALVILKGHPLTQAEIKSIQDLRVKLKERESADQESRLANETKLRMEMEQRNEQRLKGRQNDQLRFSELQAIERGVLEQFTYEQKLVNTYKTVQTHNDRVAVDLFVLLYKAERRSLMGKMHDRIHWIRKFSEIEDYACGNEDYFESKSRRILREYKPFFDAIRYSPLRMQFKAVSPEDITLGPVSTLLNTDEVKNYAKWFESNCPKHPSDDSFLAEFSRVYLKHAQDRTIPVPFDKMRKWIAGDELFSYRQLKHFAEMHPTSAAAHILQTDLKDQLSSLTAADQEIKELEIHSNPYIHPVCRKIHDVYSKYEDRIQLGVEVVYDFAERRTESYTPVDLVHVPLSAGGKPPPEEMMLYQSYLNRV